MSNYKTKLSEATGTPLAEIEQDVISLAEMQRHIMPDPQRLRTFGDYEIYGRTLPIEVVGGDFYDFMDLKRFDIANRMGIVIADASGHGLSAAMLIRDFNTALYTGISFESHYAGDTTALLFRKINRRMYRSSLPNQFITAFYGELHVAGKLRYVNAGHHPPLLFTSGEVRYLDEGGPALGAFREPPLDYRVGEVMMRPSDLLLAYTDGIIETTNPDGEEFGVERLSRFAAARTTLGARQIFDQLLRELERFSDNQPHEDDCTVLLIRKR